MKTLIADKVKVDEATAKGTSRTIPLSSRSGSITASDTIRGLSISGVSLGDVRTVSSSLADTAAHLSEDIHILLDDEFETYKKDKEDKKIYQETYSKWFPYETLSPENFKKIPKRIIREYIIASFSTYLSFLHALPKDYRQVTKTSVKFFKSQFSQFGISISEIDSRISDDFSDDLAFVEAIINMLTSGIEEEPEE
ncbi:MAG: hypothetical protein J6V44_16620 [Methanobrevibacter sp.]|nr:hypothetical protein [Methanobrevibacter sp.]MBO7691973.1 hypothetical protein [Methanobrevibacter sp.]